MKMVVNGYAGAGTIEMGGFDYHTGDRSTGEVRDLRAGQCMGACLEYAARVGVPLMLYVFSDGSLSSNGMIDNSVDGRGKGEWTGDNQSTAAAFFLVYNPAGRPTLRSTRTRSATSAADGSVVTSARARRQRREPAGGDGGAELHGAARPARASSSAALGQRPVTEPGQLRRLRQPDRA